MTLLTCMQQNKMNNYVYHIVYFCCTCLRSMQTASLRIISSKLSMRSNQGNILVVLVPHHALTLAHRLWSQIVTNFVVP